MLPAQQFDRTDDMRLHKGVLFFAQRRFFLQQFRINRRLADVLHQSGQPKIFNRCITQTEEAAKNHEMHGNINGMVV